MTDGEQQQRALPLRSGEPNEGVGTLGELQGGNVLCAEAEEGGAVESGGAAEVAADYDHFVAACRGSFCGRHGEDEWGQEGNTDRVGRVDSRGNGEYG